VVVSCVVLCGELLPVHLDLQKAAIAAVGVGRKVESPKVRARFDKLPGSGASSDR
jgi:hypothetical protein